MNYYEDVYKLRLNRFGDNFADRVKGQRIADFQQYKARSTMKVDIITDELEFSGVFKPNKQDNSETTKWLLTDLDVKLTGGLILNINDKYWMVMYLKEDDSKGYNKYLMLKMSHLITWRDRDGIEHQQHGYFFSKMDRIIYDIVRSSSGDPEYREPNKESHIIMPFSPYLKRQDYLFIDDEGYFVTGYDRSSTPGVCYYSLKQTYEHTIEDKPETEEDDPNGFWLGGIK